MYQLKRTQFIKTDLKTAWDFFSSPGNLKKITPEYMGFDVKTDLPDKMYEGLMIEYTVKPLLGIPMNWITEIKTVKELEFFVDEQRKGPYKIWHHEHHFKEVDGGVEMTDIVSYELPLGILGRIMHPFVVQKKLEEIFDFRFKAVEQSKEF
ncbi:SRPBCC family protein [Crocinitomicaceae bacterium]|mgnify:FL=1|jgi:ligand-binding SRPBCC domain-containing protein|nr:SRPBCC family protein [Flavobacteriales bacterium]MDC0459792.1 SRPBCC family protein [Crocinitomicaceae bacterium]